MCIYICWVLIGWIDGRRGEYVKMLHILVKFVEHNKHDVFFFFQKLKKNHCTFIPILCTFYIFYVHHFSHRCASSLLCATILRLHHNVHLHLLFFCYIYNVSLHILNVFTFKSLFFFFFTYMLFKTCPCYDTMSKSRLGQSRCDQDVVVVYTSIHVR